QRGKCDGQKARLADHAGSLDSSIEVEGRSVADSRAHALPGAADCHHLCDQSWIILTRNQARVSPPAWYNKPNCAALFQGVSLCCPNFGASHLPIFPSRRTNQRSAKR